MPDYTLEEARDQARRAGAYFAEVLDKFGQTYIAVEREDGVLFVAARGVSAEKMRELLKGADYVIEAEKP